MLRIIILTIFVTLVSAEKVSYENYKVFRITPSNLVEVEFLKQLENLETRGVSVNDKNSKSIFI